MHNGPVTSQQNPTTTDMSDGSALRSDPAVLADAPLSLCSDAARGSADDPAGSAAEFSSFLLLEHREPWTATAADDAVGRLDPAVGAAVVASPRLRAFAIRKVHPRLAGSQPVGYGGRTGPNAGLIGWPGMPDVDAVRFLTDDAPKDTLGRMHSDLRQHDLLFAVCTNGRRDRCCAIVGRGIAVDLHAEFGDQVVEISHLGGHRYAGTMLVLPWGYAYGFLDPAAARTVAAAAVAGLVHPEGLRGRADLPPAEQAADVLLRRELGPAGLDAVRVVGAAAGGGPSHRVSAEVLGVRVDVLMHREAGPTISETLCGGKPFGTGRWSMQRL